MMRRSNELRVALVLLSVGLLAACGGIPKKAVDDAERAKGEAAFAAKCAPEEYASAQRMMDRMREMIRKERWDEAEEAARTAQELFVQAQRKAERERERCIARLAAERAPKDTGLKEPSFPDPPAEDYEFRRIHFGFNESNLGPEAQGILKQHAEHLVRQPSIKLQIAGHCDEAGSTEYNLALGERRAEAVRAYLVRLGVERRRLTIISYGEELPLEPGEGASRSNRRAEFHQR